MDKNKPLIIREDVKIWDRWWFPAGVGTLALVVAFATVTQGVRAAPWQAALFVFGLLIGMLDGFGSGRVISYGTLGGPEERASEAEARFYDWRRAAKRYFAAALLSLATGIGMKISTNDNGDLVAYMAPYAVYLPLWGADLYRSIREANRLFPPPTSG